MEKKLILFLKVIVSSFMFLAVPTASMLGEELLLPIALPDLENPEIIVVSFAPPPLDAPPLARELYIRGRTAALRRLAFEMPGKSVEAMVSFKRYLKSQEVSSMINTKHLHPIVLYINAPGFGGFQGVLTDKQGNPDFSATFEQFIGVTTKGWEGGTERIEEDIKREKDSERLKGLLKTKEARKKYSEYTEADFGAYGIWLKGPLKDLLALSRHKDVALLDPMYYEGPPGKKVIFDAYPSPPYILSCPVWGR